MRRAPRSACPVRDAGTARAAVLLLQRPARANRPLPAKETGELYPAIDCRAAAWTHAAALPVQQARPAPGIHSLHRMGMQRLCLGNDAPDDVTALAVPLPVQRVCLARAIRSFPRKTTQKRCLANDVRDGGTALAVPPPAQRVRPARAIRLLPPEAGKAATPGERRPR